MASSNKVSHDRSPNRDERTVKVNGRSVPYAVPLFFAGLASLSYLPATVAPIGLTSEGLPVGLQIIGPEGEDPTTIVPDRFHGVGWVIGCYHGCADPARQTALLTKPAEFGAKTAERITG